MGEELSLLLPKEFRLKGPENYRLQSIIVINILKSKGYLGYTNGITKRLKTEDGKEITESEAWERVDSTAKLCILLNINEEANTLISEYVTSKDAWETLKAQY